MGGVIIDPTSPASLHPRHRPIGDARANVQHNNVRTLSSVRSTLRFTHTHHRVLQLSISMTMGRFKGADRGCWRRYQERETRWEPIFQLEQLESIQL